VGKSALEQNVEGAMRPFPEFIVLAPERMARGNEVLAEAATRTVARTDGRAGAGCTECCLSGSENRSIVRGPVKAIITWGSSRGRQSMGAHRARKMQPQRCAGARTGFHADRSAVLLHDPAASSEP
jgi:hypothetical protein